MTIFQKAKEAKTSLEYYNSIAPLYDKVKAKNKYYFSQLVELYEQQTRGNPRTLDIGCGTGDLTRAIGASAGIDLSAEMIAVAKKKYPWIDFYQENILEEWQHPFGCDFIIMADVLEHVVDVESLMVAVYYRMLPHTKLIISVINPIWEPIFMLAEKLHLKIPEGPHERLSVKETERIFNWVGFKIAETGYRMLIPKDIPFISEVVNWNFKKTFLKKLGMIKYWVLAK